MSNPKIAHLRYGIVTAIDPAKSRLKAKFPDQDGLVSHWLNVSCQKSLKDKAFWMPEVGEQVACIMDEHLEDGTVIGAIYSGPDPVPEGVDEHWYGVWFEDGSVLYYRKDTHQLLIDLSRMQGTVLLKAQTVTVEAQAVEVQAETARVDADTVAVRASTLSADTQTASISGTHVSVTAPAIDLTGLVNVDGDIDI
ncbi:MULTISPECIES: phage baseplate assembly protein V [unclassified Methylococcus]|uniref:phage baseplate assembly protein V n=1 Tax=unclassified Methylococcus TaxID=2618889 RepID=UPI003D7CB06C